MVFKDTDINYSGIYQFDYSSNLFKNIQNSLKVLRLNNETESFELSMVSYHSKVLMNSNAEYNTIFQKDYFQDHEIIQMHLTLDWCDLFNPCGSMNQCKVNKYGRTKLLTNGFKCLCNPQLKKFGPLCTKPNPYPPL